MALKTIELDQIGTVTIFKRKGQKTIRVSISAGKVRVTQPTWLPFSAGEAFAKSRIEWIKEHHTNASMYSDGQQIGLSHILKLAKSARRSSKVTQSTILITYTDSATSGETQNYIRKTVIRVLRKEAGVFLTKRTKELAELFGFSYTSVSIKHLKRRWGSCNSKKEIVYNLFLMNLDPLHIDYVILHELTHTLHMNHGDKFWAHMEKVMPNARKIAKAVRRAG